MDATLTPITKTKIEIPSGLKMMLKSFGANPETIEQTLEFLLNSGAVDKIVNAVETFERVEKKIDMLLEQTKNGAAGN